MTRINCIHVTELCDKHLHAEYREINRIWKLAKYVTDAPRQYKLGKGHVKFFYDKLLYILHRQHEIYIELQRRGMTANHRPLILRYPLDELKAIKEGDRLFNDWIPTERDRTLNQMRISMRALNMKNTKTSRRISCL